MDKAIIYPSLGMAWQAELFDPKLSGAYCRAYNCWIVDFCSDTGERLVPADVIDVLQLEIMVEKMPASTRRAILADNVAREYCLD